MSFSIAKRSTTATLYTNETEKKRNSFIMKRKRGSNTAFRVWWHTTFCILLMVISSTLASTGTLPKGSYSYVGGKSKDISNQAVFNPSSSVLPNQPAAANALGASPSTVAVASTSYYEPRGDYGGGYGGGGAGGGAGGGTGGWGGGGNGGGAGGGGNGGAVYHYAIQPQQPYYQPAPMYYDDGGGGYDGSEKGLLGLLGLSGLKGLLGLLGLGKLLLPLLALLLPLLLPLLLLKALALLALILLIPVPVITQGPATGGRTYITDTVTDILKKLPSDMNQIIGKIKESPLPADAEKTKDAKSTKQSSDKSNKQNSDKSNSKATRSKSR